MTTIKITAPKPANPIIFFVFDFITFFILSLGFPSAATTVASEKLLTFVIPDGAADQTVYKVVLNRAQDYQVLGSSKMTVQLAIDVDLGKTISGNWGGDAVIRGRGFMATDKLLLEQGGGKFEAPVKGADDSSLTFTIPQNAADGDCEFTLPREIGRAHV